MYVLEKKSVYKWIHTIQKHVFQKISLYLRFTWKESIQHIITETCFNVNIFQFNSS